MVTKGYNVMKVYTPCTFRKKERNLTDDCKVSLHILIKNASDNGIRD